MNFLFTLNSSYIEPLCICIKSINKLSNESNNYFIAHNSLTDADKFKIARENIGLSHKVHYIKIADTLFQNRKVISHTSKETYYRLLCMDYLPNDIDKVLYLDPDIVCINSLEEFYNIDMEGNLIAMASHMNFIANVWNSFRMFLPKLTTYFNAGVVLFDLKSIREYCNGSDILNFMDTTKRRLDFADQDVLNLFFYGKIKEVDTFKYNLDLRMVKRCPVTISWARHNTSIVHYDGKDKPWNDNCKNILKIFYEELLDDEKSDCVSEEKQINSSFDNVYYYGDSDNSILHKV